MKKYQTRAFTLIEILVVITMIMILLIGLSKIDLSKGQDQQKSISFSQKIQNPIETTILNSLVGKGFGTTLIVPNSYKIEISKSLTSFGGSGIVNIYYETGGSFILNESMKSDKFYSIDKLECLDISGTPIFDIFTGSVLVKGSNLQIGPECGAGKQLRIITKYKNNFPYIITLNAINGVVQKQSLAEAGTIAYATIPGPGVTGTDGVCSSSRGSCIEGTSIRDNGQTTCGTTRSWQCASIDGGSTASCNYSNPACAVPVNGVCDNTINGGCTAGTLFWFNNTSACSTTATWKCTGENGGSDSSSCSYNNRVCSPVNGECSHSNNGRFVSSDSVLGCMYLGGNPVVTDNIASDGTFNWNCVGEYGGTTATCSAKKVSYVIIDSKSKCESTLSSKGIPIAAGIKSRAYNDGGINMNWKNREAINFQCSLLSAKRRTPSGPIDWDKEYIPTYDYRTPVFVYY